MHFQSTLFASLLALGSLAPNVLAAKAFAGSSLYEAPGLPDADRTTLFSNMQKADMKVLCVWLDGNNGNNTKDTKITPYPRLEPSQIGQYSDEVLEQTDDLMVAAHAHGVKLLITMHSWNELSDGHHVYSQKYENSGFYEKADAQAAFDKRLMHIVNHEHKALKKPWKELKDYIFAFEAENEAMIGLGQSYIQQHQQWQCDRAKAIKSALGNNSGILVTTGGESWMDESVQDGFLKCASLDVISIHGYDSSDLETSKIQTYVSRAKAANKKLLYEEWGACYTQAPNKNCTNNAPKLDPATRNKNIQTWAHNINAAGLSWLYWQALPNADPHNNIDFEIGAQDPAWPTLQKAAQAAQTFVTPFDFSQNIP